MALDFTCPFFFPLSFSHPLALPCCSQLPQLPLLLHQTACVTLTTACVGGHMTPAPLSSGPFTATVSLAHESCGNSCMIHHSCLLMANHSAPLPKEAGGSCFDERPLTGIVFGPSSFTKQLDSAFQVFMLALDDGLWLAHPCGCIYNRFIISKKK